VDGNTIERPLETRPTRRHGRVWPGGGHGKRGLPHERYWIDYKFQGTPLRMRVGADLWNVDQAGLYGDDDPRFALFGEFGDFDAMVMGGSPVLSAAPRVGNDNDLNVYTSVRATT